MKKQWIAGFLALLMLFFAGCGRQSGENIDTAGESAENTTEDETGDDMLTISKDTLKDYTLTYPEGTSGAVTPKLEILQSAVEQTTGVKPELREVPAETLPRDLGRTVYVFVGENPIAPAPKAIADGKTLDTYSYAYYRSGDAIVIQGGSVHIMEKAIYQFMNTYLASVGETVGTDFCDAVLYEPIDNSALMPAYVADSEVLMEDVNGLLTPDWCKSLMMVQIRIATATKEGTFEAAIPLLDHYAEMGINCLYVAPIYAMGETGNGYGNLGLHTVEPSLTGTEDREESLKIVKKFVDEAHRRNIRVILDVITWGTIKEAPLYTEHPEFYSGGEAWGGWAFNWASPELRAWFIEYAVENILLTGADGYRCDCEPNISGYDVFATIRQRLLEAGKKIVIFAEDGNERKNAYDTEMDGVLDYLLKDRGAQYQNPTQYYLDDLNIVDSVKTGRGIGSSALQTAGLGGHYRFYTFCVSNHDYHTRTVNMNRLVIGYQAIFSPFIPFWYMGEEFGATNNSENVLYFHSVNFDLKNRLMNRMFFEDVKAMLRIRLTYPEIFTDYPLDHCDAKICKVTTEGLTSLQSYARYGDGKGILIIPNRDNTSAIGYFKATVPFAEMGMSGAASYRIVNLLTGKTVMEGSAAELATFEGFVPYQEMGVYLVEAVA